MSFGQSAGRLYAAASTLLGWRPSEFWGATPAELALALQPLDPVAELPDAETIARLKTLFPDKTKVE
jgi:hypothetical protein